MIPETVNGIPDMDSRCREVGPESPGGRINALEMAECWSLLRKTIEDKAIRANFRAYWRARMAMFEKT